MVKSIAPLINGKTVAHPNKLKQKQISLYRWISQNRNLAPSENTGCFRFSLPNLTKSQSPENRSYDLYHSWRKAFIKERKVD